MYDAPGRTRENAMKVTIFGSGYVGLVTGACLAETGNDVLCVDVDTAKVELLNRGVVPIYEPGLEALIAANREAGRLRFTAAPAEGTAHGEVIFIAVGTPPDENGSADLKHVLSVARSIGETMDGFKVIATKSTVPVGTADKISAVLREVHAARRSSRSTDGQDAGAAPSFTCISNPEFLKEGAAIGDFTRPDRIILGIQDGPEGERALALMQRLYAPFNHNHDRVMVMDVRSAEFTKYAANAMLATRISFMNELANLAEDLDADIEAVRRGIGSDPRIGYSFLYAGAGYGGSCFPKDVRALQRTAAEHGHPLRVLAAVEAANDAQKYALSNKIRLRFGEDLTGLTFAVWGLAFKPNTDDMRDAPSRVLIADLVRRGARVVAHDPVAEHEAARVLALDLALESGAMDRIRFAPDPMEALDGADALAIVTEWKAFRTPDFSKIAKSLKHKAIFDGRNMYDPAAVLEAGLAYYPIGRRGASR